ncbi:hypothetical protein [Haloarcula halophila]|uniref:hypothetical protein n=1 Tax=Haloarcula TaxID=2237 RepID=UPI0023E462BE|nr:hypothetical protein [Halomicroarcula sp. DFY41]
MDRRRALGYGVSVSVVVFVVLALPTLRDVYGPEAVLAAYAVVSLLAGALTWSLLSNLGTSTDDADEEATIQVVAPEEIEGATVPVDGELETLREQVDEHTEE